MGFTDAVTVHESNARTSRMQRTSNIWWFGVTALASIFLLACTMPITEADSYWHIRMGLDILEHWRFTGDPSWTFGPADTSWQTTQWMSEIVMGLAWQWFGWAGIATLRIVTVMLMLVSLAYAIRAVVPRWRRDVWAKLLTIVGVLLLISIGLWIQERPQVVSFILYPWVGVLLLRFMYTGVWPKWWLLGGVCIVWGWFHPGALIVAPLLVLVFLIRHAIRYGARPIVRHGLEGIPVLIAVAVAPAIGPTGINVYKQAILIQRAATDFNIIEWMPVTTNSALFVVWFALLVLWGVSTAISLYRHACSPRLAIMEGVFLLALTTLSISAGRYLGVVFLVAAPLAMRKVASVSRTTSRAYASRLLLWGLSSIIILSSLLQSAAALSTLQPSEAESPWRAWSGLRDTDGERRVLVQYNISGKTQMLTRDGVRTSLEGRSDRYGPYLEDYATLLAGKRGWESIFDERYSDATDALLDEDSALVEFLEERGWVVRCTEAAYTWLTAPGVDGECADSE